MKHRSAVNQVVSAGLELGKSYLVVKSIGFILMCLFLYAFHTEGDILYHFLISGATAGILLIIPAFICICISPNSPLSIWVILLMFLTLIIFFNTNTPFMG